MAYSALFVAGALIAMRRPAYALVLLIIVQPFAIYGNAWVTTVTLPKAALLGVLLGLVTHPGFWRPLAASAPRTILIAAILVLAATILSGAHAMYDAPVLRESLKALEYVLVFVAVVCAYRLDPDVRVVRNACVAVVTLVALFALSQEVYGATSGLRLNGRELVRVAGPLEGPNQLAGYCDVATPLLLAFAVDSPALVIAGTLFLIVLADVLTFSRGGGFGVVAGTLAVAFTYRRPVFAPLAFIAAGIATGLLMIGFLAHTPAIFRVWDNAITSGGAGTRTHLWRAAFALWRSHPVFGIGAGNFELVQTGLRGVRTHANSLYLQSLVEGGIPSLAATLWMTYVSIAVFAKDRLRSPFVAAAFAGSIALALHQIFDLLVFYPKVGGWWWIVLGLGAAQLAAPARLSEPACA